MPEEIKEILDEYKEHTDKKIEEVKRHFDVCKEDTDSKMVLIGAQYGSIQENIEVIKDDIEITKNDVTIIKTDNQLRKNSLKKKVDLEDFEVLESRVRALESKIK